MQRQTRPSIVAITQGNGKDGIAEVIADELSALGYHPLHFQIGSPVPEKQSSVLVRSVWEVLNKPRQLAEAHPDLKPIFVHWNTEVFPTETSLEHHISRSPDGAPG
jgi:hypothetical protein